jgi:hypothetical protein
MLQAKNIFSGLILIAILLSCSRTKIEEKGFSVSPETDKEVSEQVDGLVKDSLVIKTRPSNVLLTGYPQYRLTTIYKINYNKRTETTFIGSDNFYYSYSNYGNDEGNNWNYNFLPGLEILYGYNMVNVSLHNHLHY